MDTTAIPKHGLCHQANVRFGRSAYNNHLLNLDEFCIMGSHDRDSQYRFRYGTQHINHPIMNDDPVTRAWEIIAMNGNKYNHNSFKLQEQTPNNFLEMIEASDDGVYSEVSSSSMAASEKAADDVDEKDKANMLQRNNYVYNPRPIRKKSRKKAVPDLAKNTRYWLLRMKNNMAAKKSREARRNKEIEVISECSRLKKENDILKQENYKLRSLVNSLEKCLNFQEITT